MDLIRSGFLISQIRFLSLSDDVFRNIALNIRQANVATGVSIG